MDLAKPYITPEKLFQNKQLPIKLEYAFICYCPMPTFFESCQIDITLNKDRYFISVHNNHILFCECNGIKFIVVAEVYGGPVSVTTIEELRFYGIKTIIGIGFVGSLNQNLAVGTAIKAKAALVELGTTPHYLTKQSEFVQPTFNLGLSLDVETTVWTTNALYQEYYLDVIQAIKKGCQVVNMDTSHLYACCAKYNLLCEYFAIVSDVIDITATDTEWVNHLSESVNGESLVTRAQNQLIKQIIDQIYSLNSITTFSQNSYYANHTISNQGDSLHGPL